MSDNENKDYSAQSRAVINKKERDIEKAKDLADAFKKEIHKVHKSFLTDEDTKDKVRQEILNGVRGRETGNSRLANAAQRFDDGEGQVFVNEGTITGFENEKPYWKREND